MRLGRPARSELGNQETRSRKVCMTCHFFRHHPSPECIPLLTCHLHPVTARKDDARAADQAAITNVVGMMLFSGGG